MNRLPVSNHVSALTLSSFEIFKSLTREEREVISLTVRTRQYKAGNFIISTTQSSADVFFIIGGKVRVCAYATNGRQVHFEDLSHGQMFGELAAIDGGERSSDCIAAEDSLLAYLPRKDFLQLIHDYPEALNAVLLRLTAIIRHQMQRVYEFGTCSVNQRVRFELLRLASDEDAPDGQTTVISPPTHSEIAQRIATHREAVSREIARLQTDGIITWRRGTHVVHDKVALLELASSNEK